MPKLRTSSSATQLPGTRHKSVEELRRALGARLQGRLTEIEQTAATRVFAISGPNEAEDPEYVQGLRAATVAALEYGLAAIERGERSGPVPGTLLEQARQAARYGISLDTVLRRYFAGYTLLGDFVAEEAQRIGRSVPGALREVQRAQAALFDRLIAAVSEAHRGELEERAPTLERRRAECVRRLLDGELANTAELAYELEGWHVGLVIDGPGAAGRVRDIASSLDRRLLAHTHGEAAVWAWLGGRHPADPADILAVTLSVLPESAIAAVGEAGEGLAGWRLSHRQARAALVVALGGHDRVVRYGEVSMLCTALKDDLLASSLRGLFLAPLEGERDGGAALREALNAYFASGCNATSAAAALGVSRQGVTKRLRIAERRLGRPLSSCAPELQTALRLRELGPLTPSPPAR